MSRIRNKQYRTIHHLTSRIAHRVFFLKEEERNDFISLVKRVSAFSGIELIGWCIMTNHFHLLVYLPVPPILSDEEVLRRFALLKNDGERIFSNEDDDQIGVECPTPDANSGNVNRVRSIRRRMYSIAEYMRMIKKWFSDDYNLRNGHKGTMWEAIYNDNAIFLPEDPAGYTDLRDILAYIHLNPIRAAITDRFDTYGWSSYTAFCKGDPEAVRGMRTAYRGHEEDEISTIHEERMNRLLEAYKRKRAMEIARKRADGYEIPSDSLTDECMIAQAVEHAAEVQRELERIHAERQLAKGAKERRDQICRQIQLVKELHPDFSAKEIAQVIDAPSRTVQRYIKTGAGCPTPDAKSWR